MIYLIMNDKSEAATHLTSPFVSFRSYRDMLVSTAFMRPFMVDDLLNGSRRRFLMEIRNVGARWRLLERSFLQFEKIFFGSEREEDEFSLDDSGWVVG